MPTAPDFTPGPNIFSQLMGVIDSVEKSQLIGKERAMQLRQFADQQADRLNMFQINDALTRNLSATFNNPAGDLHSSSDRAVNRFAALSLATGTLGMDLSTPDGLLSGLSKNEYYRARPEAFNIVSNALDEIRAPDRDLSMKFKERFGADQPVSQMELMQMARQDTPYGNWARGVLNSELTPASKATFASLTTSPALGGGNDVGMASDGTIMGGETWRDELRITKYANERGLTRDQAVEMRVTAGKAAILNVRQQEQELSRRSLEMDQYNKMPSWMQGITSPGSPSPNMALVANVERMLPKGSDSDKVLLFSRFKQNEKHIPFFGIAKTPGELEQLTTINMESPTGKHAAAYALGKPGRTTQQVLEFNNELTTMPPDLQMEAVRLTQTGSALADLPANTVASLTPFFYLAPAEASSNKTFVNHVMSLASSDPEFRRQLQTLSSGIARDVVTREGGEEVTTKGSVQRGMFARAFQSGPGSENGWLMSDIGLRVAVGTAIQVSNDGTMDMADAQEIRTQAAAASLMGHGVGAPLMSGLQSHLRIVKQSVGYAIPDTTEKINSVSGETTKGIKDGSILVPDPTRVRSGGSQSDPLSGLGGTGATPPASESWEVDPKTGYPIVPMVLQPKGGGETETVNGTTITTTGRRPGRDILTVAEMEIARGLAEDGVSRVFRDMRKTDPGFFTTTGEPLIEEFRKTFEALSSGAVSDSDPRSTLALGQFRAAAETRIRAHEHTVVARVMSKPEGGVPLPLPGEEAKIPGTSYAILGLGTNGYAIRSRAYPGEPSMLFKDQAELKVNLHGMIKEYADKGALARLAESQMLSETEQVEIELFLNSAQVTSAAAPATTTTTTVGPTVVDSFIEGHTSGYNKLEIAQANLVRLVDSRTQPNTGAVGIITTRGVTPVQKELAMGLPPPPTTALSRFGKGTETNKALEQYVGAVKSLGDTLAAYDTPKTGPTAEEVTRGTVTGALAAIGDAVSDVFSTGFVYTSPRTRGGRTARDRNLLSWEVRDGIARRDGSVDMVLLRMRGGPNHVSSLFGPGDVGKDWIPIERFPGRRDKTDLSGYLVTLDVARELHIREMANATTVSVDPTTTTTTSK